eukprot:scaffold3131_cov64-Attheya_sp.AAC.6
MSLLNYTHINANGLHPSPHLVAAIDCTIIPLLQPSTPPPLIPPPPPPLPPKPDAPGQTHVANTSGDQMSSTIVANKKMYYFPSQSIQMAC